MKYECVLQQGQKDCGIACLTTVAKHYGLTLSLLDVQEVVGARSQETTLLGLRQGAEALGFQAYQVQASLQLLNQLEKIPLPAIIHWQYNHWVVLYGYRNKKYIIADPNIGIRYLTLRELITGWSNNVMLLLCWARNRAILSNS